jgi:hypothetical protein
MTRRFLGLTLMIGGVLIALVGVVGWMRSGERDPDAGPSTTTTAVTTPANPTATEPSTTTTVAPTTTSTTVPSTTTTTIDAGPAIESFVDTFTDAIERQDIELLVDTLHSAVISLFGEDTCRAFIFEEILQLQQYRLIGQVEGPMPQVVADTTIDMFRAPAAFVFQGQEFTSEAGFAFENGEVRWFTQCGG